MARLREDTRIGWGPNNDVGAWVYDDEPRVVRLWWLNEMYTLTPDQAQAIAIRLLQAACTARGRELKGVHLQGVDDEIADKDRVPDAPRYAERARPR